MRKPAPNAAHYLGSRDTFSVFSGMDMRRQIGYHISFGSLDSTKSEEHLWHDGIAPFGELLPMEKKIPLRADVTTSE
jgi:hypothetical protein